MRFKFLTGLVLVMGQVVAMAQVAEPAPSSLDVSAERERIARERDANEAIYAQSERGCYSRFAVSDCLREARMVRRTAMDELRLQELVLNDMDRQNRAMDALKRIQTNVATQQQQLEKAAQPEAQP